MSRAAWLLVPGFLVGVAVGVLGERRWHPPAAPPQAERLTMAAAQPQARDCTSELNTTKVKLAICMAYQPEQTAERQAEDSSAALNPAQQWIAEEVESVRRYQKVLREHKEVVVVQRADNSIDAFPVGEPIPDGIIVGRRLPSGEMGWYAGSGSREDPASFLPFDRSHLKPPVFRTKEENNAAAAESATRP